MAVHHGGRGPGHTSRKTLLGAFDPGDTPAALLRIVPNGATGAYVIAPHAELGAIAYELTFGNGGDTSTPNDSIGGPNFGGWRWTGTHRVASVGSDPTAPLATLHDDIGSVDSAMEANFGGGLFGGDYHGGIEILTAQVPSLTEERYVDAFNFGYTARITWPDGETADVAYDQAIQPDGNLAGSISYTSSHAFTKVFLSMVIADAFTHYSADGSAFAEAIAPGTYGFADASEVVLRQASTGYQMRVTRDISGLNASRLTTEVINNNTGRLKDYVRVTSGGLPLGTVSMSRSIAFELTDPDPEPEPTLFHWVGATDGATWTEVPASTAVYLDGATGELVLERGTDTGAAFHRALFAITVEPSTSYRLPVVANGGGGSAGCFLDITPNSNGSTTGAVASDTMANVISRGYLDFTSGAAQTTLYVMFRQQPSAGSAEVMRVSEIGPMVAL